LDQLGVFDFNSLTNLSAINSMAISYHEQMLVIAYSLYYTIILVHLGFTLGEASSNRGHPILPHNFLFDFLGFKKLCELVTIV
jgi:hypothetical protein